MPLKLFRRQQSKKQKKVVLKLDKNSTPTTSEDSSTKNHHTEQRKPKVKASSSLVTQVSSRKLKAAIIAEEDTADVTTQEYSNSSSTTLMYPSKDSMPLDLSLDEVIQEAIAKEQPKQTTNQRYLQRGASSASMMMKRNEATIPAHVETFAHRPSRSNRSLAAARRQPSSRQMAEPARRNRLKRSDSDEYRAHLVAELHRMGLKKGEEDDEDEQEPEAYPRSSFPRTSRSNLYDSTTQRSSQRNLDSSRYPYASYGYNHTTTTPHPLSMSPYDSASQRYMMDRTPATTTTSSQPGSFQHHSISNLPSKLQTTNTSPKTIEIAPGVSKNLRGAAETSEAIAVGYSVKLSCMVCTIPMSCIADCEMVLCPDCMVVSPNTHEYGPFGKLDGKQGVGLGLVVE